MTSKSDLRDALQERRRALVEAPDAADRLFIGNLEIAERVAAAFGDARIVAAYISDGYEVDPLPILFQALGGGRETALPRVATRETPLSFHAWSPGDELVPGPWGLLQPRVDAPVVVPDFIIAPLLGFDRALNRLGQGAGFYDRAFAAAPAARRIGVAWSVQEVPAVPLDPWDVPLHGLATEREWIAA